MKRTLVIAFMVCLLGLGASVLFYRSSQLKRLTLFKNGKMQQRFKLARTTSHVASIVKTPANHV